VISISGQVRKDGWLVTCAKLFSIAQWVIALSAIRMFRTHRLDIGHASNYLEQAAVVASLNAVFLLLMYRQHKVSRFELITISGLLAIAAVIVSLLCIPEVAT
jgi:hypothetical protein